MPRPIFGGLTAAALIVTAAALGGCFWRTHAAVPDVQRAPATPAERASAPPLANGLPASAARAACTNYDDSLRAAEYPRDAIIRGIDAGTATVTFTVDGSRVTVLTIASSDPSFGDVAARVVRQLVCRTDRPTTFTVPFSWRSGS